MISVKLLTNDRLELKFRYDVETKNLIKSIPGAYYHPDDKYWSIPREQCDFLEHMFPESLAWLTPPHIIKDYELDLPTHEDLGLITEIEGKKLDPYPFQKVGISFMVENGYGILADEMGLGKTLQALFTALELYNRGKISNMLVICPSSLKKQWGEETHKFLDENHIDKDLVTVIDGTKSQRKKLYEKAEDSFITILNYSLLYYDFDKIQELNPDILTLDEAHYIKNRDSKRTKLIKKIDSNYRYAMTGTPIQNKPDELYSIVEFLDKDYFGSYTSFKKEYVVYGYDYGHPVLRGYVNFDKLSKQVAPIMMRRRLADVKGQLPEATFTNRYVQPTPLQKRLYKQIQEEQEELDEEIKELRQSKNNSVGRKKGLESELRKVEAELNSTDEPNDKLISRKNNLISEISKISNIINSIQDDLDQKEGASQGKNALALGVSDGPELLTMSESYMVRNNYDVTDFKSPKLIELKKIVTEFIDMDYKVIVFSRLAKMVKLIKRELSDITRVATLYGAKSSKERDDAVKMFENDPFCGVIAMSDAGAEGLNLQFSKALINYDLRWNPSKIDQRVGRIRRLGATHDTVNVINIINEGMIDERMLESNRRKRELSESIIENNSEQNRVLAELAQKAGGK